jgi:putative ABC transport system ATP-binding protein
MQLTIRNLLPVYFENDRALNSEIWGKEIIFNKGDLVKIVAPSGSGKTSLIHFLYGLRKEYNGNILYDDKTIGNFSPEDFAVYRKDHISVVLQDLRLFPEQTVRENLEIKRQLNPHHRPERITEMANQLGIGSKLNSLCRTCSYGEQQRVAIIRSLLQPFDVLLMDEPFSHLDTNNAQNAMELLLDEAKLRNATIIFADLERIDFFPWTRIFHL